MFLSACGESENNEEARISEAESEITAEVSNPDQLVGEHITIQDSSIELPFPDPVTEAYFSEDGTVKLFVTKDMVLIIDDTEIVHVAEPESAHIRAHPTVSADGKYAIWRRAADMDDFSISVFDVENRTVDDVESTEDYDVQGVYLYLPLIEKVANDYYLVTNNYLYGSDVTHTLNLETKEMYAHQYPEDQEVLDKLKQEPVYSGEDSFGPQIEGWANQKNLNGLKQSYYGYYLFYYETGADEEMSFEQAYGVYSPEPKTIDLNLEKHEIDLADPNREIERDDVLIHDNGSLVFTQYELNDQEEYKMYTYYIDLSDTPADPALIHEGEFHDDKQTVFFNHDATGVYIVEEGKMNLVGF
jgi:uncharacterized protein (UPF0262 family)